ncbi:MAG: hypothetical protein ACXAE3_03305 [Candidatus Kariarchaeaceae archaeon]|jgi:hypothetical protein
MQLSRVYSIISSVVLIIAIQLSSIYEFAVLSFSEGSDSFKMTIYGDQVQFEGLNFLDGFLSPQALAALFWVATALAIISLALRLVVSDSRFTRAAGVFAFIVALTHFGILFLNYTVDVITADAAQFGPSFFIYAAGLVSVILVPLINLFRPSPPQIGIEP